MSQRESSLHRADRADPARAAAAPVAGPRRSGRLSRPGRPRRRPLWLAVALPQPPGPPWQSPLAAALGHWARLERLAPAPKGCAAAGGQPGNAAAASRRRCGGRRRHGRGHGPEGRRRGRREDHSDHRADQGVLDGGLAERHDSKAPLRGPPPLVQVTLISSSRLMEYVIPVVYTRRAIGIYLGVDKQVRASCVHRGLDPKCRMYSVLPYSYLTASVGHLGITKCSTYRCTTLTGSALYNNNGSCNGLIVIASCSVAQRSTIEHSHNSIGSSLYDMVLALWR